MADLSEEIESLFASYADAFNDFDGEAIADLFAYPTTIWQFGKGFVFDAREDLLENINALLSAFEDAGVVFSKVDFGSIQVGQNSCFAEVQWSQENDAGEVIHDFDCEYMLIKTNDEWAIATVVNPTETSED